MCSEPRVSLTRVLEEGGRQKAPGATGMEIPFYLEVGGLSRLEDEELLAELGGRGKEQSHNGRLKGTTARIHVRSIV